jgi:predicted RND superfamily exporter protein
MKQSFKLKSKKGVIIGAIIGVATLLIAAPSYAFSLDSLFQGVIGEVKGYFEQTKEEVTAAINEKWGGLKNEAKVAVQKETGAMKLPNPVGAADKLKEQLKEKGSWNESNTVEGAVVASKELERETTRATIESVLGQKGQERTKKEIEATEGTVSQVQQIADEAQTMDASQDVLKAIAAQNAQIASMLGQSRTDGLQQRHDAQQTNLMLSQIAEQGASERKRQNLAVDGINAQFMQLTGYSSLKITASKGK